MPYYCDTHTRSAQTTIGKLQTGQVTFISLDHDLGDYEEFGSGYTVALWIENEATMNPKFKMPEWDVHSQNPVGRQKIIKASGARAKATKTGDPCTKAGMTFCWPRKKNAAAKKSAKHMRQR